ncbi:helix-turn-helix transcriptional regulator [Leptotrichia sp.]|jgi:toxin-antitoxin system, antitoxin component, xre family|uniref:helix-turn-helix domain-containing protein n=1 Tax=Leptotrichia sp. TaxID=104608 RepID=UPI0017DC1C8D|nr:helix-turn-helix transcriptional regulator [Leptotrichia sp.]MBB1534415.1 helix-turn-helix transcriptional regulator [Leptotrichia sp.]
MENTGKRLKELRENFKYSLEEVAEKINSSAGTISRYENNERKINSVNLLRLADLFNVSPKYILYGTSIDKIKENELENKVVSFFTDKNRTIEEKEEMFNRIQNIFFKEKYK